MGITGQYSTEICNFQEERCRQSSFNWVIELGGGFQSLISLGFYLCIKKIGFFVINILCYVCLIFSGIVMDKMELFILSRGDMILFLSDFLISFSTERGTNGFPKFWVLYSK